LLCCSLNGTRFDFQIVEDGLIVFNRNTVKKFTLPNAAATINRELSELALFSCDINNAKKCIQTYGYIKSNDSSHEKYYAFDSTSNIAVTSDYILGSSDCAATTTDYGKLKANKLCIGNGIEIDFSDTGKYKYKYDSVAFATNPFTRSASPDVIIDVGANHMIVDGLYLSKFILFKVVYFSSKYERKKRLKINLFYLK